MTALTPVAAEPVAANEGGFGFLRRPSEGWLTLAAAAAMVITQGWSFVDANWTPQQAGNDGFLLYVGSVGLAFGFAGAKLGWGRWRTHVIAAIFAGIFLPLIAGGLVLEYEGRGVGWDPVGLAQRMHRAFEFSRDVWIDLVVLRLPTTFQSAHYQLVFGALVWGAGLLAGYTIFGHRRPLDAVVVLGLVLLANMAMTENHQEVFLVAYSAASLLLLVRTHIFDEQVTWARRRIGEPAAVGRLYLNGGSAFVAAAVLGSIVLMLTASSAPLQGLWRDLPAQLRDLSNALAGLAPGGGNTRPIGGTSFSPTATSSGVWNPSDQIAFNAQLPPGEEERFKWRAGTYAVFNRFGWQWGPVTATQAPAGEPVLSGQADQVTGEGRRPITIDVVPDAFTDPTIVAPNSISSVSVPTVARTTGTQGYLVTIDSAVGRRPYTVEVLVPIIGDADGGLTEARLRSAGFNYPEEVRGLYLALPPDALGPEARDLLARIRAEVEQRGWDPANPYDLARTMEDYLSDDRNFTYATNIQTERDTVCSRLSMVECFAIINRGYCEYYASTMAVLLREAKVPARIAYGFLPGERDANNQERVGGWLAHWWVEVYFPGVGWVEFDPTGGPIGQQRPLPSGSLGPQTPRPSLNVPSRDPGAPIPTFGTGPNNDGGTNNLGIGPFIAIGLILLIGFGALAVATVRRTPSRPMDPDVAWGSLARLAARFGLGPRPSQTVYEYAGALGDEVPSARVELTTIARAKVEVAYGRRSLDSDSLKRIALAFHRLRLAIIGVVVRRVFRRGRGA
ncbi:MAG TPA: transglutaminase domain-containing protein [Candidatus Binatia bacterium]|nr:transglutaminase domain-containing protein [Candidatus Binatia bacterium]